MKKGSGIIIFIAILLLLTGAYFLNSRNSYLQMSDLNSEQLNNLRIIDQAVRVQNPSLCSMIEGEVPFQKLGPADEILGYELDEGNLAIELCEDYARIGAYPGP